MKPFEHFARYGYGKFLRIRANKWIGCYSRCWYIPHLFAASSCLIFLLSTMFSQRNGYCKYLPIVCVPQGWVLTPTTVYFNYFCFWLIQPNLDATNCHDFSNFGGGTSESGKSYGRTVHAACRTNMDGTKTFKSAFPFVHPLRLRSCSLPLRHWEIHVLFFFLLLLFFSCLFFGFHWTACWLNFKQQLRNGFQKLSGEYRLSTSHANGHPMWQRAGWGEEAYLYSGRSGKWSLGHQKCKK